jgi:hypothetical protein
VQVSLVVELKKPNIEVHTWTHFWAKACSHSYNVSEFRCYMTSLVFHLSSYRDVFYNYMFITKLILL